MWQPNQNIDKGSNSTSSTNDLHSPLLISQAQIDQDLGLDFEKKEVPQKSTKEQKYKQKVKQHYQKDNNILQGKNFFSNIFFLWISPFADFGNYFEINKDNSPIIPENKKPKIQFDRLYNILKTQNKKQKQGWLLTKCIAKAFGKDFLTILIYSFFFIGFSMYTPILTDSIIKYVQQGYQNRQISKGILLFIAVVLVTLLKMIFQSHTYYSFGLLGFNLSNTLSLLLYEKSLKHPVLCLKKYSVSQIINYSQVDAQRMTYMGYQLTALIFAPIQVLIGLWLMYSFIGISFLSGIGVMVLTLGLTILLSKITVRLNENVLKAKDQRMKITEQILNIIRFVKINSFEKYFWKKLNQKRQNQLKINKKKLLFDVLTIFLYWLSSPLILSMTFATYTWMGNQMSATQAFTTIMLFRILQYPIQMLPVAISSIIQMWTSIKRIQKYLFAEDVEYDNIKIGSDKDKFAIKITNGTFAWGKQKQTNKNQISANQQLLNEFQAPRQKNQIMERKQSCDSADNSLVGDQIQSAYQQSILSSSVMDQSILSSPQKQSSKLLPNKNHQKIKPKQNKKVQKQDQKVKFVKCLKQVNLKIQTGTFTMILGDIGSGKSSLLYAILNQMKPHYKSRVQINGSIAYAPQKPWIMSATLRDNITFTQPFDRKKFDEVIHYASMKTDLGLLVGRENAQIGQKGTNLSGGQKARIGLARALYSDRDIYLLDDIISAVDVHVGEFLIKETILNYLKNKTIVMPTHAIKFAQYADNVIIMKKGVIIKQGSYEEVKTSQEFLQLFTKQGKKRQKKKNSEAVEDKKLLEDLKKLKEVQKQKAILKASFRNRPLPKQSFSEQVIQQLTISQDRKKGEIGFQIYKQYINLNGGIKFIVILFLTMVFWLSLNILSNIWMEHWCESQDKNIWYLYVFLILSISSSLFMLARAYFLIIGGIKCGSKVHKQITKSLLYASLNHFYNRVPLGRIINRLSKDLRQIDETIGVCLGNFVCYIFGLVGTLVICLYASTYLVLIPIIIVAYFSNRFRNFYMKTQRQCVRLQNITSSPIVSGFLSTINGVQTIRAYNLQQKFIEMQIDKIEQNKRFRVARSALQSWFCQRLSNISFLVNMTAIAFCMFSSNENSSLTGLLLSYALTLADDIINTMFSLTNLQNKMISVQRISNFMKIQPEQGYAEYTQKWSPKEQGYKNIFSTGNIQFKNVKIRYREDLPPVLKGLTLQLKHGQKLGIVGRTGAGKSTIINCLLRVLQCSQGQILIDGKSIKDYFLKDLRYNVTMIDQQPVLINGTFRENLDPLNHYSQEQLLKVIKQCNLLQAVEDKGGIDSKVSNQTISIGQKQLLCICRAFLKKSKIVLVDEATANIDQKNDKLIQDVISTKFKDSTVLTIAHRLSTLMNSDKILVLGQGRILQWGSPQQLIKKENGIYRQMCQKGKVSEQFLS